MKWKTMSVEQGSALGVLDGVVWCGIEETIAIAMEKY